MTSRILDEVAKKQLKDSVTEFNVGDTVRVRIRITEGKRQRLQNFEGVVIRKRRGGIHATFTVRKISYGVGVERTFPLHSPKIEGIEIVREGHVRRSRLYDLRGRVGKKARVKSKRRT